MKITNITDITGITNILSRKAIQQEYALEFLLANTDDIVYPLPAIPRYGGYFYTEWKIKFLADAGAGQYWGASVGGLRWYIGKTSANILVAGHGGVYRPTTFQLYLDTWYKIRIAWDSPNFVVTVDDDEKLSVPAAPTDPIPAMDFHVGKFTTPASSNSIELDYIDINGTVLNFTEGSGTTTYDSENNPHTIISDRANTDDMWKTI